MRTAGVLALVAVVLGMTSVGAALGPKPRKLAEVRGAGLASISIYTNGLHQVILHRIGGSARARGTIFESCGKLSERLAKLSDFVLDPGGRKTVWRYQRRPCVIAISVAGRGMLDLELRGS